MQSLGIESIGFIQVQKLDFRAKMFWNCPFTREVTI